MEYLKKVLPEDWQHPDQFDPGIDQIVLANTLDETRKCGIRTRVVRFQPRAKTRVPFVHDYHEEVYLLEGDQVLLDAKDLTPVDQYHSSTYFKRPAGTYHGPFSSEAGCLLLEVHYYGEIEANSFDLARGLKAGG